MCPHLSELVKIACGKYKCGKKLSVSLAQPTSNQEVHPRNLSCRQYVSLLNRQFDFPVAQDQRFCHKIVSYHKIFHIANHENTPISISHAASSCCWAHVKKTHQCIYIYTLYHQRHILSQSPYPKHCQQPIRNKTHQETPVKGVRP